MKKQTVSIVYVINIVFQAIFTLAWQMGLGILVGWLATTHWGAENWIYVPLILVTAVTGFFSMIRFILSAMRALDGIEAQHERDEREGRAAGKSGEEDRTSKEIK